MTEEELLCFFSKEFVEVMGPNEVDLSSIKRTLKLSSMQGSGSLVMEKDSINVLSEGVQR